MEKLNKQELYFKYDDLVYYTHIILRKYPEIEKMALVSDIKNNIYRGMEYVILYFKSYNYVEKLKYLNLLDVNVKMLCFFIRLSYREKYINSRNYHVWSSKINDFNNLIGALVKTCVKH